MLATIVIREARDADVRISNGFHLVCAPLLNLIVKEAEETIDNTDYLLRLLRPCEGGEANEICLQDGEQTVIVAYEIVAAVGSAKSGVTELRYH
jgi:hypothetical protein